MNPQTPSITSGTAFEGMFVRALQPTGAFADALRALGYDPALPPRVEYPSAVWDACLEVARQHTYPALPRDEGLRQLGRRFVDGYFQTLTGRVLGAAMRLLPPAALLERQARAWMSGQPAMRVTLSKVAERCWRIHLRERDILGAFCAGMVEATLGRVGIRSQAREVEHSREHCVLEVTWDA